VDCDGIGEGDSLATTWDWYARERYGDIRHFGEESVDDAGSPEAGKDVAGSGSNAEPGIVMLAHTDIPTDGTVLADEGVSCQQEYPA